MIIETERFHQHILILYLIIHYFLYRNIHPTIHVNSIQQGSADFLFENANNQTLKKITHLNRFVFEMLYEKFDVYWKRGFAERTHFGQIHYCVLNGRSALGLILFHMAHSATNTEFSFFASMFLSFCGNISLIASSNSVISPTEYDVASFSRPYSVFFGVSSHCLLKIRDSCSLSSFTTSMGIIFLVISFWNFLEFFI
jgi:hypothetical protein